MASSDSYVLTAVKVWAATAWADGVITAEEAHTMNAVISVAKLSDDERARARTWLDDKVELDDVDVDALSAEHKRDIYAAALGIVTVDHDVADAETVFLDKLRKALGIDEKTAEQLHAKAGI